MDSVVKTDPTCTGLQKATVCPDTQINNIFLFNSFSHRFFFTFSNFDLPCVIRFLL